MAAQPKLTFTATTLAARPDLKQSVIELCTRLTSARPGVHSEFGWPNFLYKGPGGQNFFDVIFGFPEYQTLVIAQGPPGATGTARQGGEGVGAGDADADAGSSQGEDESRVEVLAAVGYAAPCVWDGKTLEDLPPGWDHVILTAKRMLTDPSNAPRPNAMSALAVEVCAQYQGRGLSKVVLGHMKQIAEGLRANGLLAPIRPTFKPQYPLVDMEEYVRWRLPDPRNPGEEMVFDPWLRTHIRLGATILRVARGSAVVRASLSEWHAWTGMHFLSDGPYPLPGGLVVLQVDRGADVATYSEDNVWVAHVLAAPEAAAPGTGATELEGEDFGGGKRQRVEELPT